MTDKKIIKALECCIIEERICEECPYESESYGNLYCDDKLMADAFDFIKIQQEEIKNLKIENQILSQKRANIFEITKAHERGYIKAIKDFSDRLKELYTDDIITNDMVCPVEVIKANIDDIAEEMAGGKNVR